MFNSQLNKLKSGIKNTERILNFSSNVIGDSNYKTNFWLKLLSTDTQDLSLHKSFAIVIENSTI